MQPLRRIRERHARYYLNLAKKAISNNNFMLLELELENIRVAWDWLSYDKREQELIIAYGEVAWNLFEMISMQLSEAIVKLREAEQATPHKSTMIKQMLKKLNEIAQSQIHLQSTLGSGIIASGERGVSSTIIVNSNVVTGDNVVIQSG